MKILFLSRWFPYPANNGSKIRIFNLLKYLANYHEIDLISFHTGNITTEQIVTMQQYCQQVKAIPYQEFNPNSVKSKLAFLSPTPRSFIDTYNPDMSKAIESNLQQNHYEIVIASQFDMAFYTASINNIPVIFEEIELTTYYEEYINQTEWFKKIRSRLMWWKRTRYTAKLLAKVAGCTVVSHEEQSRIQQIAPHYNTISVISNGVDVKHYQDDFGSPNPDTLVYAGALSFYANFDAMEYFIGEILPIIQEKRPDVKLAITGKHDENLTNQLPHNDSVIFTGYLDDIRPTIAQSWLSIAPLRLGGGTRLKILEALAAGTPVVSTQKGAEGLSLTPYQEILIADTPAEFATAVIQLLADATLRQRLSQAGRQAVAAEYDWQIIGQKFNEFITTLVN